MFFAFPTPSPFTHATQAITNDYYISSWHGIIFQNPSEQVVVTCRYEVCILEDCKTGLRGREHRQNIQQVVFHFFHLYSILSILKLHWKKRVLGVKPKRQLIVPSYRPRRFRFCLWLQTPYHVHLCWRLYWWLRANSCRFSHMLPVPWWNYLFTGR